MSTNHNTTRNECKFATKVLVCENGNFLLCTVNRYLFNPPLTKKNI